MDYAQYIQSKKEAIEFATAEAKKVIEHDAYSLPREIKDVFFKYAEFGAEIAIVRFQNVNNLIDK